MYMRGYFKVHYWKIWSFALDILANGVLCLVDCCGFCKWKGTSQSIGLASGGVTTHNIYMYTCKFVHWKVLAKLSNRMTQIVIGFGY